MGNDEAALPRATAPSRIGLLPHPHRPKSPALAEEIAAQLRAWGVEPFVAFLDDLGARERLLEQDMLVALGGDGTLLRLGHHAGPRGIPMLCINLGSLGFLSEVQPDNWRAVLQRVVAGDYWLEDRAMLTAELRRGERVLGVYELLNEATVARDEFPRPLRLRTSVNGEHLATYLADGLIIATATGSTAYALAAGGPILAPQLRNLLVIPIAPHLSLDRAVVLDPGAAVRVEIVTHYQAIFTGDGEYLVRLEDGDEVYLRPSPYVCRFVRTQPASYFYGTLMRRMGLEKLDHE